ncbi:MAG TPA: GNAT family protein [Anaerolineae bacterium]
MHYMLLDVSSKLETPRLRLRPYKPGDGQWLHKVFQENRVHLWEAIEGVKVNFGLDLTNLEEAEIFVRRLEADWITRQRFIFGVWEKSAHRYVGEIWIENRDWEIGLHEIGYYVVKEHLGQGIATEATQAGLKFIFKDLKANKVSLTCDEDNASSYQVAERCGFSKEGCHRDEVKRSDGTLVSKLYYGMLKKEFEALKP